jgi:predicted O-methyltransferase YrrM
MRLESVHKITMFEDVPEILPEEIYKVMLYAEKFYILDAALELEIFEKLKQPTTSQDLAALLGTDPKLTRKLCDVLVAMGLLKKRGELYENTSVANTYLVDGSPFCQRNLLKLMRSGIKGKWTRFLEVLRGAPPTIEIEGGKFDREFVLAMAEGALRGDLQRTIKILSQLEDIKKARKFLDLGGGHGLYAIALAKIFPNLQVFVLDLPHVIDSVTKEVVNSYGMGGRIHLIPADVTKDEIGGDYDVILASDIFYPIMYKLQDVLKKVYASLSSGGILVSKHWHLEEGREAPLRALLFDLQLSSFSYKGFDLFTVGELISYLNKTGFVIENVIDISSNDSPSKLVIARRAS